MLRPLFLFFVSFTLAASPWVVDRKILEERLKPESSVEELLEVLKGEGIDVRFKEEEEPLLWKGNRVSISLAASPFVPYHLWIGIEGKRTMDECSKEDFEELYRSIWIARKALKMTTGSEGFLIFSTEKPRNGKGSLWAGVELLPYLAKDSMDAKEKGELNGYMLYNDFPVRAVSQSRETVAAIRALLPTLKVEIEPEAPQSGWTQKLTHHREALHQSIGTIYDQITEWGALSSGAMPPAPPMDDEILENRIDLYACAFCNPKVIARQIVSDWNEISLIMSHKPLSPFGNFLILPKRHQCSWDLTPDESVSFFEAASAVKRMLVKRSGSDDCILYIQDGPGVGQTVPHTHMHIFIVPQRIKTALTGIEHIRNKRRILAEKEMREACEMYQTLFLDEAEKRPLCNSLRTQVENQDGDAGKRESR